MKKILIPYDFSRGSELALAYAAGFACRTGAEVTLVHVVSIPDHFVAGLGGTHLDFGAIQRRAVLDATERARKVIAGALTPRRIAASVEVLAGFASLEITKLAASGAFDLVILATQGRTGLSRVLLGSVAETVVRTAPCPVLALKLPDGDGEGSRARDFDLRGDPSRTLDIARILVPTDLSDHSFEALEPAARIAETFQASLTLLHVVEDLANYTHIHWEELPGVDPKAVQEVATERARTRLRRALDERLRGTQRVSIDVACGDPVKEIVDRARDRRCDLIVTSTHGRSGWRRTVLGSVAERVVRLADCPVMTVPARDPEMG